MSYSAKVRFISDLHHGHKNILNFAGQFRGGHDVVSHSEWLVDQWNSVVKPKDTTWVLGDICFDKAFGKYLAQLEGSVRLVLGNHDKNWEQWVRSFKNVYSVHGAAMYKDFWVTHIPIHPCEMRNRKGNIHGHVHNTILADARYFPVCVEQCYGVPIEFDEIKAEYDKMPTITI